MQFNIVTMNVSYFEIVKEGVQYRIAECDNVEKFADRKVYLSVSDRTFYNNEAYLYNEKDGTISRNDSYQGVNALFELPLDKNKAAEKYLKELQSDDESEQTKENSAEESLIDRVSEETRDWELAEFNQNTVLIKEILRVYRY